MKFCRGHVGKGDEPWFTKNRHVHLFYGLTTCFNGFILKWFNVVDRTGLIMSINGMILKHRFLENTKIVFFCVFENCSLNQTSFKLL